MTLSGKNPVLTLVAAAGGQSMISYGKHTLLASWFLSESAHRWDYLSASVGFPLRLVSFVGVQDDFSYDNGTVSLG